MSSVGGHWLLVTYSRGPQCTSGVAGCGPRPHTCGAEVIRVNVRTGDATVLWRVVGDDLLRSAALSPDGTLLAARASPCVPSYFNDHLVIRRLSTGESWTIGAGVARCHWVGNPQWTADSSHLVVTFAPPTTPKPYTGPDGTCASFGDNELVKIDALHPAATITGSSIPPRHSCTWDAVASDGDNTYAAEACGHDRGRLDGPVHLVQLSKTLQPLRTWSLGRCTDGDSIAADPTAGVIIAAYLFCNPPPRGQKLRNPITVLDRLQLGRLHRIATAPGGNTAWDDLAW